MGQKTPVPQEAVDALQRGDLLAAFKTLREQGRGVNLQSIGNVLEAHARQYAEQQGRPSRGQPPSRAGSGPIRQPPPVPPAASANAANNHDQTPERKRTPTVAMGDPPGSMRWVLVVLGLLGMAAWIG
ncbi:MAG: hypothetical protein EOP39_28270, partial [Rubrivivax sp.]